MNQCELFILQLWICIDLYTMNNWASVESIFYFILLAYLVATLYDLPFTLSFTFFDTSHFIFAQHFSVSDTSGSLTWYYGSVWDTNIFCSGH